MNDEEQLRSLYAGLAMLGYVIRGHDFDHVVEDAVDLADALLDKVKEERVRYTSNRGLAAVKPRKKKE